MHFIMVMIRWTGLAPWEFEFLFPGSLTTTFLGLLPLEGLSASADIRITCARYFFFFALVTGPRRSLSLKLSDTRVYEP